MLDGARALEAAQAEAQTAFPIATLSLLNDMPESADALRAALSDNRMRDLAAGRTLIGPHRADLEGTYAAKGIAARDCSSSLAMAAHGQVARASSSAGVQRR